MPVDSRTSRILQKGSIMKRTRLASCLTLGVLGLGVAVAAGTGTDVASLLAQETRQQAGEVSMQQGKVKSLLKNDHDDVDGLLLQNGLRVHFPPHMGEQILAVAKIGDMVKVEGREEVTPRGDKVFEITRLVQGDQTVQVEPPRPPRGPAGPGREEPMNAAGKVSDYARNPHGEVDGLILADDTVVKFPPHQGAELQKLVAIGDKVTISGRRHVTPHGDVHLHADRIEVRDQTLEREGPKPGSLGHGPRDHGPHTHGPRGPRHDPAAVDQGPTNADLLRELKAIRQLLERQS